MSFIPVPFCSIYSICLKCDQNGTQHAASLIIYAVLELLLRACMSYLVFPHCAMGLRLGSTTLLRYFMLCFFLFFFSLSYFGSQAHYFVIQFST